MTAAAVDSAPRTEVELLRLSGPQIDAASHDVYRQLLAGRHGTGPEGVVAFCVYTDQLALGRGDIYVAAGLGRALVARGWGVRFIPMKRWGERVAGVDAVVALLPAFDPSVVPASVPLIGWARNETDTWSASGNLPLYDMVLSSSRLSLDAIERRYAGPTEVLAIGVDHRLFHSGSERAERTVVTTSVNHWGSDRALHRALARVPKNAPIVWYGETQRLSPRLRRFSAGMVSYFALPDAYRRSLLVLDDMNHTTLPYGNINSRVFEALACGALVVTNGSLGLGELGLGEVPVYRTAEELLGIIERYRADPVGARALAAELQSVVLDRHTFDRRADEFLAALPAARDSAARRRPTIGFFPDYAAENPYQRLLYAGAEAVGIRVVPVQDPAAAPAARDTGGKLDDHILHVHWTAPILHPAPGVFDAYRRLQRFQRSVDEFRGRGGQLFWTVHNVLPHDARYRTLEIELRRYLASAADVIHVLGPETAAAAAAYYRLPPEKVRIIGHCSYVGVYPDFVERAEARRRFGLLDAEIALLLLGGIRTYKGMDNLLPVFDEALAADPRLRLLVAGKPEKSKQAQVWRERCARHPRIVSSLEYVPSSELQVWMRAADVVVLPYGAVLNSGALQLALSFGRPVVAPVDGEVASQLDPAYAVSFLPKAAGDLLRAIQEAVDRLATPEAGARARDVAERRPPAVMSDEFLSLLRTRLEFDAPA